ncbi:MAG: VOC family protein [Candidatus Sericytochromatia bacterium]|nr:VOC family protein [Candidatus Tanganyikabacteria bacterium]
MSERDTLDHVAIQVEDVARAVAWYRETFSVDVTYQDETWALLAFANVRLALVVPGQHPSHVAVVRPDAASFGPLKPHRDGTASVYVRDSEGNVLEIMAPYA